MDNFQHSTVKRLVQFMYTGNYDDPKDEDETVDRDLSSGIVIEKGRQPVLITWRFQN